jgi:two-component system sensor histidine kinase BaeS
LPRPPPTGKANPFRERVAIYGLDGAPLLGPGLHRDENESALVERPVSVNGQVIATVRMIKLKPVQDDMEMRFLISQYSSIAFMASILLLIALICARWVAGQWVRPLLQIQSATDKIAAGDFDVRLHDRRTDEIGDVMRNVNRMAAELEQLEGVRRQWIADISHELRTPLTVLRGEVDALIDGIRPLGPQAIESLRDEVHQLTNLVDDLHLLSMSDMRALPCYFEELDAVELVRKVAGRFSLRSEQLGLDVKVYVNAPETITLVRWDGQRVGQLIGNLLDNSLRYTDPPGRIAVTLAMNSGTVTIDVDDSPPDVPDADLSRLFEPLYRADVARSRHSGGSGLGLAICEAIVKAHHGSIEARPSVLGGVQIHIELPRFAGS